MFHISACAFHITTCVFHVMTCVFHITFINQRVCFALRLVCFTSPAPNAGHQMVKSLTKWCCFNTLVKEGAIPGQYVLGEMNKLRGVLPRVVFLRSQVLYLVVGVRCGLGISPIQSAHQAYQQGASMHRRAGYGGAGKGAMARVCRAQAEVRRGPGRP